MRQLILSGIYWLKIIRKDMDSKQRVKKALSHCAGDRVPVDFWSTEQTDKRIMKSLELNSAEELLRKFKIDLRYIEGPRYTGPDLKRYPDGTFEDIWGTLFKKETAGPEYYYNTIKSPLKDLSTLEDMKKYNHWPSPDWFDYSDIYRQCLEHKDKATVFMGSRLNRIAQLKPAMYLRGMENILVDMYLNKDIFDYIIYKIIEFYSEYERRILEASKGALDILMTGDDFGTQDNLLISPDAWKKNLKQGFSQYIDIAHSYDVSIMHHTCGSVYDLIPEFIDCGLDILQSIQPDAQNMDLKKIKKEFGNDISFQGGISIQKNLPLGKPEDIDREVKTVFDAMKSNGGYIACTAHNIQSDTPVENILALIEAYDKYGEY